VPLVYVDKGTKIDVRTGDISIGHIGNEMFSETASAPLGGAGTLKMTTTRHHRALCAMVMPTAWSTVERNWTTWRDAAG
jgi:hypothetical protein